VSTSEASPFLVGIAHFNRGEFFEAHEMWELLWRETTGPRADFYKGLIQCAVAFHHLRRGNLDGARRVYHRQRQ
jgi:predicted metal-dependent hydrolase